MRGHKMKLDALDHPKTLDFAARLGVELPTAIGHLELLWAFTAQKAPQGNIGKWPDGAIARACYWNSNPDHFVSALVDSKFVDTHPEHRLLIHDWSEHAPRWVRAKLAKAKLNFIYVVSTVMDTTFATIDKDCSTYSVSEGKSKQEKSNNIFVEASSTPFITIPLNTGDEHPIHESQCAEWGKLFPAVDVRQELRSMRAWCIANPRNRKTRSGIMRFATSWLGRAQNKAGKSNVVKPKFGGI